MDAGVGQSGEGGSSSGATLVLGARGGGGVSVGWVRQWRGGGPTGGGKHGTKLRREPVGNR